MVKKLSSVIAIILLLILGVLTIYKLNKQHEDKLYDVMYSRIEYASKRCNLEGKCEDNFTLRDLYDKKYLNIEYDPITKEELDSSLKISVKKNKVSFDKVNE